MSEMTDTSARKYLAADQLYDMMAKLGRIAYERSNIAIFREVM